MKIDKASGIKEIIYTFNDDRVGLITDLCTIRTPHQSRFIRLRLVSVVSIDELCLITYDFKRTSCSRQGYQLICIRIRNIDQQVELFSSNDADFFLRSDVRGTIITV